MVTQLGWEPLQVRRVKICLLLLFKTQHNLVAIPAEAYLLPTGGNLIYTVRNWAGGKLPSVSLNSSDHGTGCCCCRWKVVPIPDGSWEKGVSIDILPG
jgi:hypothetical protein